MFAAKYAGYAAGGPAFDAGFKITPRAITTPLSFKIRPEPLDQHIRVMGRSCIRAIKNNP